MKLRRCRTLLFMPGNNPGMLTAAANLGADVVIYDLEDAVAQTEKDPARILVRQALKSLDPRGVTRVVRINSLDTAHWRKDLPAVVDADLILLPKCEKPEDLQCIWDLVRETESADPPELMALVESAKGVENVSAIASFKGPLAAILLGGEDLTADLGARRTPKGEEILYARSRVLTACKAAGIKAIDTPFPFVADLDGLALDAAFAAHLGFDGKAIISPRHILAVNSAFSPSEEQIEWAKRVLVAAQSAEKEGKGATSLDGMMVDLPIIKRAQRIIDMAGK